MIRPTHYVVTYTERGQARRELFAQRAAARRFRVALLLRGIIGRIEPRGF